MKILTLNTHSILEENYEDKLIKFVEMLKKERLSLFALQEVNQSSAMPEAEELATTGYVPCKGEKVIIRQDNHAYRIARMLKAAGKDYHWTWVPAKVGYGIYDEGIALFSESVIEDTERFYISQSRDYNNWKTRMIVGICTKNTWFYSVHMGWWNDGEEPFRNQWDKIVDQLGKKKGIVFVMGDFNSPSEQRGEGYDYVTASGWIDTWMTAWDKDDGITVGGKIDGWKEKEIPADKGMRIDYIFCNRKVEVLRSKVVFNGENYPVVSDHYGVLVEIEI